MSPYNYYPNQLDLIIISMVLFLKINLIFVYYNYSLFINNNRLKKNKHTLTKQVRLKKQLLATLIHDIRTPLYQIKTIVEEAIQTLKSTPDLDLNSLETSFKFAYRENLRLIDEIFSDTLLQKTTSLFCPQLVYVEKFITQLIGELEFLCKKKTSKYY